MRVTFRTEAPPKGSPISTGYVDRRLMICSTCLFDASRSHDPCSPPCDGSFEVRHRRNRTFIDMVISSLDTVCIDRLKPAKFDTVDSKYLLSTFASPQNFNTLPQALQDRHPHYPVIARHGPPLDNTLHTIDATHM